MNLTNSPITIWLLEQINHSINNGDSISQIAIRSEVPRGSISRVVNGRSSVSLATADRIAACLEVSPAPVSPAR